MNRSSLSKLTLGAVALAVLIGGATPAKADPWHDHGRRGPPPREVVVVQEPRPWYAQERYARWHRHHYYRAEPAPRVVYAPPPVVYAPPPQSPGLTLVLPLNFE